MQPVSEKEALDIVHNAFSQGKQTSLLVTGSSMVPFLRNKKDWVFLAPAEGAEKVGDILLFRAGDRLLLHRLRKKKDGYYVMNGDGRRGVEIIRPQQVEARVTNVVRRSGRVIRCNGILFSLLSWLWWPTRPFRPWILPVAGKAKELAKRVKGVLS